MATPALSQSMTGGPFVNHDGTRTASYTDALATWTAAGISPTAEQILGVKPNPQYFGVKPKGTLANADGSGATGENSIAIGPNATASGALSIAMGFNAVASGTNSVALGAGSAAQGYDSVSIGIRAGQNNTNNRNTFVGAGSGGTTSNSVAVGYDAGQAAKGERNLMVGPTSAGSALNGNLNIALGQATLLRAKGDDNIGIGTQALKDSVGSDNLAIGSGSGFFVRGDYNLALGSAAGRGIEPTTANPDPAPTSYNTAIGLATVARGGHAIAIGAGIDTGTNYANGAMATGEGSVAIGSNSTSAANARSTHAIALGAESLADAQAALALGYSSKATGVNSTAIGPLAATSGESAIALGFQAQANVAGGVAIGAGSISNAAVATSGINLLNKDYVFAGAAPTSSVSIGSLNNERTLTNLAAGRLSATSTDAVNGSQLFATNQALSLLQTTSGKARYVSINSTRTENSNSDGATGENAMAIGALAEAAGVGGIAIGHSSHATSRNAIYIGSGAGQNTSGVRSMAVGESSGQNSKGEQNSALGFEAGNMVIGGRNTSIGSGAGSSITGEINTYTGHNSGFTVVGSNNTGIGAYAGQRVRGSDNTALGFYAGTDTTGSNNTALGDGAGSFTTGSNNTAIGSNSGLYLNGSNNIAIGQFAGSGENNKRAALNYSLSLGNYSKAGADYALAIGSGAAQTDQFTIGGAQALAAGSLAIGSNATRGAIAGATDAISIGGESFVTGASSVAIGRFAQATALNVTSIGVLNSVSGARSTAIGNQNNVTGAQSGAFGSQNLINGANSYGIGNAINLRATAENSVALGNNINILTNSPNSVALGTGTSINSPNSVALGANSRVTVAPIATTGVTLNGTAYVFAGNTAEGSVSIGRAGEPATNLTAINRTLLNLAAGRLAADSTDGVNGSQLFATNQEVEALGKGFTLTAEGANGTRVGHTSTTGNGLDLANTDGNLVIAKAADSNSVSFDLNEEVKIAKSLTVGGDDNAITEAGANFLALAVNDGQLLANTTGAYYSGPISDANHIANKAYVDQKVTTAAGEVSHNFTGNAGDAVTRTNGQALAIAGLGTTTGDYSGNNLRTVTDPATGAINLQMADAPVFGGLTINAGGTGKITGLTAGELSVTSTEAVNGSQLFATNQTVDALGQGFTLTAEGANGTKVGATSATGNSLDLTNTDDNIVVAKADDSNTVTFNLADNVEIANSLTVGGTFLNQTGLTSHGLSTSTTGARYTGPITAGDHIANKAYVDQQVTTATGDVNIGFAGNEGDQISRRTGQVLAIAGLGTTTGTYSGSNLRTVTDPATGAINMQLADAPVFGALTINAGGTGKITGVTAGELSATSTEAVNGSQLFATNSSLTAITNTVNNITTNGARTAYVSVNRDDAAGGNVNSDGATANNAVAIGVDAAATRVGALSVGYSNEANERETAAVGFDNTVSGYRSSAFGHTNRITGANAVATGFSNRIITGTAAGINTSTVNPDSAAALGRNNTLTHNDTLAAGTNNVVSGLRSAAIGRSNTVSGNNAYAFGQSNTASGLNSIALGTLNISAGLRSIALGNEAQSNSEDAIVLGSQAGVDSSTTSNNQLAIGTRSGQTVNGNNNQAFGLEAGQTVNGHNNQAIGTRSGSNVTGSRNIALGWQSGNNISPNGLFSSNNNVAVGSYVANNLRGSFNSFQGYWSGTNTVGNYNVASGNGAGAYVVGDSNVAIGNRAGSLARAVENLLEDAQPSVLVTTALNVTDTVALGSEAVSTVDAGVAIGARARVDGANGLAIGNNARVTDARSIALGDGARTQAAVATSGGTLLGAPTTFAGAAPVGTLSIGSAGNERTLTNLAAGRVTSTSTDAVNGSQLFATNQAVDVLGQGFTLTAEGANGTKVGSTSTTGNSLDLTNTDDNIVVAKTADSNSVAFNLADNVEIANSLTVGGTVLNQTGLTSHGLSTSATGARYTGPITAGDHIANKAYVDQQVTNATGDVSIAFAGNQGDEVSRRGGQVLAITGAATTAGDYSGGNLRTVTDPATGAINLQLATAPTFGALTINAGGTGKITGLTAGELSATSTEAVNGSQLFATNQTINNLTNQANAGFSLSANSTNTTAVSANSAAGNTVNLANTDDNIVVAKAADSNSVAFNLADNVEIANSLTVGGTVLNQTGLTSHGLSTSATGARYTGPITAGDHIANKAYVDQQVTSATGDVSIAFAGNQGDEVSRRGGQVLAITGAATTAGDYSGGNLRTVTDPATGAINLQLATAPTFGALTINAGGTGKITGLTAGELSATSTEAVNGSQLFATNQTINNLTNQANAGFSLSANGTNTTAVSANSAAGNTVNLANTDDNIVVAKEDDSNDVSFNLADDVRINNSLSVGSNTISQSGISANNLIVSGETRLGNNLVVNSGGATYTGPITDGNHLVNKAYVDASVSSGSGNANIGFGSNEGGVVRRTNGQDLIIRGDATTEGEYEAGNIRTTTNAATGEILVEFAEAPRFGDVTVNDGGTGRITGVAAGVLSRTSTHAVNGSQLVALGDTMAAAFSSNSSYNPATNTFTARIAVGDTVYNNVQDALAAAIRAAGNGGNGGNGEGWTLQTDQNGAGFSLNNSGTHIAPGGSVTFNGSNNIEVSQNGTEIQYSLNRNLTGIESISIDGGPTLNSSGINMNGGRITNLADGVADTDAVNVRQLNTGMANTLIKANEYTDSAIGRLAGNLDELRRDANGGTAASMAMGSLPLASSPGTNMVGMGVSTWGNEQAVAVGYSRSTSDGRYVVRATGSFNTRSQGGASVGFGFQF